MSRLVNSVVLEPVPRDWFEDNVGFGHDVLTDYLGRDLPLASGEHLSPGARYAADELTVTVDSWNRRAETSGQVGYTDEHVTANVSVRLVSASAPRSAELTGDFRTTRFGWLTRVRGSVRADLERWWDGTAHDGREPAIEGWAKHWMFGVSFAITSAPGPDGAWQVTVRARLRARGVLAPLTALGLRIFRLKIQEAFVRGMDEFVEDWNREVPELLAADPDELRARFLASP